MIHSLQRSQNECCNGLSMTTPWFKGTSPGGGGGGTGPEAGGAGSGGWRTVWTVGGGGSGGGALVGSWNDTGAREEWLSSRSGRARALLSNARGHSRMTTGPGPASGEATGIVFTACHGSSSAAAARDDNNTAKVATHHGLRLVMVPPSHP